MFRLQRFLSIANFLAIAIAAVLLAFIHTQLETEEHNQVGERENLAFSSILQNTLQSAYRPLLVAPRQMPGAENSVTGLVDELTEALHRHLKGTSVVKVKIYDLQGNTVFSTQISEIAQSKEVAGLYQRAIAGEVVSKHVVKDWAIGSGSSVAAITDLLETYIPIRDQADGRVIGVFELYSDITPLMVDMRRETLILAATVVGVMLVLYLGLLMIGHRAESLIRRQEKDNREQLKALEDAREQLESRVVERTEELLQSNQDLLEEVTKREAIEYALRANEEKFRLIATSVSEALLMTDTKGGLVYSNRAAERLFGIRSEQVKGRSLLDFLAPRNGVGFSHYAELKAELRAGDVNAVVQLVARPVSDDPEVPVEASYTTVEFASELHAIWMLRDISARLAAEERIKSDLRLQQVTSTILRAALEPLDLAQKLTRILELVVSVHCFDRQTAAAIFLGDDADGAVLLAASTGLDAAWQQANQRMPLNDSVVKEAILFQQAVHIEALRLASAWALAAAPYSPHYLVPILASPGRTLGILILYNRQEQPACPNQEGFLLMVAHTLASVVERHQSGVQVSRLSLAVEQSQTAIMITDRNGSIEYVNQRFTSLTGYTKGEALGQTPALLKSGLTPAEVYQQLWQAITAGREWRGELLNRKKNGELFWESQSISPIKNEPGEITHFIAVKQDVTESRQQQELLRIRNRAIEDSNNAICILSAGSPDVSIVYVNPSFCAMTEYAAEEVVGENYQMLFDSDLDREQVANLREVIKNRRQLSIELQALKKQGRAYWCELSVSPVYDEQGEVSHFVLIMEDISDRKRTEQQLVELATHDSLTGLPNRSLLKDRLAMALAQAQRNNRSIALLFIDLDQFKLVNDNLGHSVGDELLVDVAQRLLRVVRSTDTVGRQGGDEFVLILNDVADGAGLDTVIQKIFLALQTHFWIAEQDLEITCSIGSSLYPTDGDDVETLFRHADIAMHCAKAQGGNHWQAFQAQMGVHLSERTALLRDLREAIERDQFSLHYQPKVDLNSGRIVGAEALIRWLHPERGLVPPVAFIPVAEEAGLILAIGEWVLHEACRQQKIWSDAGFGLQSIAVNLSARQIREDTLVALVESVLSGSGLAAEQLELEITESMMMENPEMVIRLLRKIKAMGVHFAIDDFGTGYSSLAYLKRFPIDRVKVDREFVKNIETDPADAAIVNSTITMSHNLHCRVVAEGVETQEQARHLRALGCDEIQGYYFSRPLPSDEFTNLLRSQQRLETRSLAIVRDERSVIE